MPVEVWARYEAWPQCQACAPGPNSSQRVSLPSTVLFHQFLTAFFCQLAEVVFDAQGYPRWEASGRCPWPLHFPGPLRFAYPVCRTGCPIDEIPLFSNYSPCFHKIGYIQKIVYNKINYLVKSMIEKSVYFYKIGRFFPGQGGS